jgi:hypothetical protein
VLQNVELVIHDPAVPIVGVTSRGFRGSVLIFSPDFFVPIVNQEQVDGTNLLNDRGNRWLGSVIGCLKAGVTPALGYRRSELDWFLSGKDVSQRGCPNDLYLGA